MSAGDLDAAPAASGAAVVESASARDVGHAEAPSRGATETRVAMPPAGRAVPDPSDPNDEAFQFAPPDRALARKHALARMPRDPSRPTEDGEPGPMPFFVTDAETALRFGDGLSFWFIMLKVYGAFFALLTLVFLYFFVSTHVANESNGTSSAELSTFARASLGAILYRAHERARGGVVDDDDKNQALAIVLVDAVAACSTLIVTFVLYKKKEQHRIANDLVTVDVTDYTVEARGVPPDAAREDVERHFARFGEIHDVVFARDVSALIRLREKELRTKAEDVEKRRALRQEMAKHRPILFGENGEGNETDEKTDSNTKKKQTPCRVVAAFVTFATEEGRAACDEAVARSIETEGRDAKHGVAKNDELSDVRAFVARDGVAHRLVVARAPQPSDLVWDNFGVDRDKAWLRKMCTNSAMLVFLVLQFIVVAYATRGVESAINPEPQCSYIGADGDFLNCPSIWDLDSETDQQRAVADILPFVRQSVSQLQCSEYMVNGAFESSAMLPYSGFATNNCTAFPDAASADAFRGGVVDATTGTYAGGFIADSVVDECAAHLCYACFCDSSYVAEKQGGGDERRFDGKGGIRGPGVPVPADAVDAPVRNASGPGPGPGGAGPSGAPPSRRRRRVLSSSRLFFSKKPLEKSSSRRSRRSLLQDLAPEPAYDASTFCDEYDDDLIKSDALAVAMIVFTLLINISLKGISRGLSAAERPHSFTELEKSVCRKMSYSLMINMVALPLALTADVSRLSKMPLVFDGSHRDTDRRWYQGYSNKFSQLALTNAIVYPITSYVPVFKWALKLLFTRNLAKTQYQLNAIYAPPQYDLAQRAASFAGCLMYSLLFSSAVPLVYPYLCAMCVGFLILDRVALNRFMATPPRYRGKICAYVIHSVPAAVVAHFAIAVYVFGTRDLPSYVYGDGVTGSWEDYGTVVVEDSQGDVDARLKRVNGLVPFLFFASCVACCGLFYRKLWVAKRDDRRRGIKLKPLEGAPPVKEALERGLVYGLPSYALWDHPEYKELFPKGHDVCRGL